MNSKPAPNRSAPVFDVLALSINGIETGDPTGPIAYPRFSVLEIDAVYFPRSVRMNPVLLLKVFAGMMNAPYGDVAVRRIVDDGFVSGDIPPLYRYLVFDEVPLDAAVTRPFELTVTVASVYVPAVTPEFGRSDGEIDAIKVPLTVTFCAVS